MDEQINQTK